MKYYFGFIVSSVLISPFFTLSIQAGVLTHKQQEALENVINKQVKNKNDRLFVLNEWSEAHRVAEFSCRPIALAKIRKKYPETDKVMLGRGHNQGITLHSSTRMTGEGQYRMGSTKWYLFNFECMLEPDSISVKSFIYSEGRLPGPGLHLPGPGPAMPVNNY
ncbi:DUF930 domain-containing protein [Salmonella enterica subsp. enterica serovar Brandenburg]|nr:DUF930 domain-containing protein [Salmonella enterica subsp. enterica]ECV7800768.1 DUF930 domain-containing protein [Salmonella enterica subsp. enterica serovar Brandenburg]EDW9589378.1 DUF930 domain-containing protein [Salmonella enterica subsp. enterica]EED9676015.1 DUF930 domain-containing protein [Salmonella enterica subsp. enterica]